MKKNYKYLNIMLILFLFVLLSFLTVSYAKFLYNGSLSGVAVVPSKVSGVIITDVTLVDSGASSYIINSYDDRILNTSIVLNNNATSFVTYEVTVTNYDNQSTDYLKYLVNNTDNNDIEIIVSGVDKGTPIGHNETLTFTVTYKFKDGINNYNNNTINSEVELLFGEYVDPFPIVFSLEGPCTFNGNTGNITGDNCIDYSDSQYIDTGVSLYSSTNASKDYEIYFEIVEYNPNNQDSGIQQQTFMVSKIETGYAPGVVVRRSANNIEISHKNGNDKKSYSKTYTTFTTVKIVRKNGIVYHSVNGAALTQLQNITGFSDYFDNTVWFGAAYDSNGNPFRLLRGTLANMYIKLGKIEDE